MFLSGRFTSCINGFPTSVLVLIIGVILSFIVFFTSRFDSPPKYHAAFSVLGFIVAGSWTYFLASEVVSLLKAVGILINLSDVILGLTVLAWGNSLGDFISNLSMARQGFPKMGISACFGGPLLSELSNEIKHRSKSLIL
jgi:sodium/potassium/calcium exchanger 6